MIRTIGLRRWSTFGCISGAVSPESFEKPTRYDVCVSSRRLAFVVALLAIMVARPSEAQSTLSALQTDMEQIAQRARPAVVTVFAQRALPLSFLLTWMLLSARLLRLAGWLFAGAARSCQRLALRRAAPDRR